MGTSNAEDLAKMMEKARDIFKMERKKPLIYLASPHFHDDWFVREERYRLIMRAFMYFFGRGDLVFSPILHTHQVNMEHQPFEFYRALDEKLIDASDEMWVVCIEGWRESRGVQSEIKYATSINKPIRYWEFDWNQVSSSIRYSDYLVEVTK